MRRVNFLAGALCACVIALLGAAPAPAAPPSGTASCVGQDVSALATASGAAFAAVASGLAKSGTLGQIASAEAQITTNCPG